MGLAPWTQRRNDLKWPAPDSVPVAPDRTALIIHFDLGNISRLGRGGEGRRGWGFSSSSSHRLLFMTPVD